jgi:hypothetical protein
MTRTDFHPVKGLAAIISTPMSVGLHHGDARQVNFSLLYC